MAYAVNATRADCERAVRRVWLLDLDWSGRVYRLSTEPVTLTDTNGVRRQYVGGILNSPEPTVTTNRTGVEDAAPSAPLEVSLPGVDVSARVAAGSRLQEARGDLFEVFVDIHGDVIQTWRSRVAWVVAGRVKNPQMDAPDTDVSVVRFTLEGQPYDNQALLLDALAVIDPDSWPESDDEESEGKIYPVPVGVPGDYRKATGERAGTSGSPAYPVEWTAGEIDLLLVSDEWVDANTVTIFADGVSGGFTAGTSSGTLYPKRDGRGRLVTVVDISGRSSAFRTAAQHHVVWSASTGGGIPNPYGTGPLRRLGDVCRWIVERSPVGINLSAWIAEQGNLNRYAVDTFFNDAEETVYEALQRVLESFPHVGIRRDANGLRPVLRRADYADAECAGTIYARSLWGGVTHASPDFHPEGDWTYQTDEDELVNDYTIRFARRVKTDRQRRFIRVTPEPDVTNASEIGSEYADHSLSRTGDARAESLESSFLYDEVTAGLLALEQVRFLGFGYRTRPSFSTLGWGWLEVNEVYLLTNDVHTDLQVEVLSKTPVMDGYEIVLSVDDDPVRMAAK